MSTLPGLRRVLSYQRFWSRVDSVMGKAIDLRGRNSQGILTGRAAYSGHHLHLRMVTLGFPVTIQPRTSQSPSPLILKGSQSRSASSFVEILLAASKRERRLLLVSSYLRFRRTTSFPVSGSAHPGKEAAPQRASSHRPHCWVHPPSREGR
jgi:hypothetical protein